MHSDREALAFSLKEKLEAVCPFKKVFVSDVFSGCGTNIGPGMLGVYFFGEPVTEELSYEKQTLLSILGK